MTLEGKILQANKMGIKFILVQTNLGIPCVQYNEMLVPQNISDDAFEELLDAKIKHFQSRKYLQILMENDLI